MPSRHKAPLLGWHPPAELQAWVRAEAERRGVPLSVILNEAVTEKRTRAVDAVTVNRRDLELTLGYVNVSPLPVSVRRIISSMHGEEHIAR